MFGICLLSIVPCRKKPSDKSEMTSQLLFGETFEIMEEQEKWLRIKNTFDAYESWIDRKQAQLISEKNYNRITKEASSLSGELVQVLSTTKDDAVIPIVLGSSLPMLNNQEFEIEKTGYTYEGHTLVPPVKNKLRSGIVSNAYLYLNSPYLWGGRTPFGIDCSGFTQIVFKLNGIPLMRDAAMQARSGKAIDFLEESLPGDLAFFDNELGKIVHVGILIGDSKIIHASGKVRIDKFDQYGIYHEEKKAYTHQLRIIKSMI